MAATTETSHCIRPDHLGCNAEEDCHAVGQCQARQNAGMAQTNKEKQEAFRARQAMLGATEVRGIFLPPELHAELKAYAKTLAKKHKPETTR